MSLINSGLIASALLAGFIAVPGTALAQSEAMESPPAAQEDQQSPAEAPSETPGETEAVTPTDAQLDSFAAATIDIVQIQESAQKQMQAAVEEAGLTIEEYNEIARAAQTDPDIDQTLQQLIQDRLGG